MRNFIYSVILCATFSAVAFGQCGALAFNPVAGQLNCTGPSGGAPTGAAGGVLSGTYPNPGFAASPTFTGAVTIGTTSPVSITDGSVSALNVPNVSINLKIAPYNASGSATTTTTSGTFGVGTSGTITSCSTFSAGHGIYIAGAGAAGVNYIGTVVSCSAGALVITPATATSVGNGTLVQHDDSAALQAAVTALASTGGSIYAPDGYYRLNGPLQDTGGANAVIAMPAIQFWVGKVPISIEIFGSTPPAHSNYGAALTSSGVIFQTDVASGNLFGGYATPLTDSRPFTFVRLGLRNLTLRAPDDPAITMVNALYIASAEFRGLSLDVNTASNPSTQPTHSNGRGIIMPDDNNWAETIVSDVQVYGYYVGLDANEHTSMYDVQLDHDLIGLKVSAGTINHPVYASRLTIQNCPTGIQSKPSTGGQIAFSQVSFENNPQGNWTTMTLEVDDNDWVLLGYLYYTTTQTFTKNGAGYLALFDLHTMRSGDISSAFQVAATHLLAALPLAQGGTDVTSAADDSVLVSNGTAFQAKLMPDCIDTAGQHLNFTSATNAFSCGNTGGGGGGGANTALSNLASVSINTSLLAQASTDLGATATPFRNLYFYGNQTYGTNYGKLSRIGAFSALGDDAATQVKIGAFPSVSTYSGLWGGGVASPSSSNYYIVWANDGSELDISDPIFKHNGSTMGSINNGTLSVGSTSGFIVNGGLGGYVTKYAGISTAGIGIVPTFARIWSTAQSAAIGTATLCAAATCTVGQYRVSYYLDSTVVCGTPGPGAVGLNITWTDETGTHSAQVMPLAVNSGLSHTATMALGDATTYAFGLMDLYTSGANAIQYSTSYTGCTTGTGTYAIRLVVEQIG